MKILSDTPACVYHRDLYAWRKAHHICTCCGHEDARRGKITCANCAEKEVRRVRRGQLAKKYRTEEIYRDTRHKKRLFDLRRAFGVCTYCGKRDVVPGRIGCSICIYKERMRAAERRKAKGIYPRDSYSELCWQCRKVPHIPGKKLCASCYEKSVCRIEKARSSIDRQNHIWRSYIDAEVAECRYNRKLHGGVSNEI